MKILAIETSCDETAAAVVENGTKILAQKTATSIEINRKYGGVVPEVSARKQAEFIIPVLTETLQEAGLTEHDIDAIAVTYGPGLIGSLLIGIETAKVLSIVWNKPLVPVNHLVGHIYSAWLMEQTKPPTFPALAVIISGGHTELVVMNGHNQFEIVGQTRDDAAGEAFDKVGRALGLPYPAGPEIEKVSMHGNPNAFDFPRPMITSPNLDFSFSGLKTAVLTTLHTLSEDEQKAKQPDLAASFQQAVIDVVVAKTVKAIKQHEVTSVLLTGGVSANKLLRNTFANAIEKMPGITFHCPPITLATDNATYIASAAFFNHDAWALHPNDPEQKTKLLHLAPNANLATTE